MTSAHQRQCTECGRRVDPAAVRCMCGASLDGGGGSGERSRRSHVHQVIAAFIILATVGAIGAYLLTSSDSVGRARSEIANLTSSETRPVTIQDGPPLKAPSANPAIASVATPLPPGQPLPTAVAVGVRLLPSSPTPRPTATSRPLENCDRQSYPDICIPRFPPELNCSDVPFRRFRVLPPDPHRFDADRNGIGCE